MVLILWKMVIHKIRNFIESQKRKLQGTHRAKARLDSFRETDEMRKSQELKREADRLAQLKQYKTAIEEYNKALELYPFKGNEENLFKNAAEFVFKCNYNIAACYSYLDNFNLAIDYFDKSLMVETAEDENKVRALMGKGSTYYRKKMLIEGKYKAGVYRVTNSADWEVNDDQLEEFRKEDVKRNYIRMAHLCFKQASELDKYNVEAYYCKGHMEYLMGEIKNAVQSFDNVLSTNKNYENKEGILLYDEIRREKGIKIAAGEVAERVDALNPSFKSKTGHLFKTRTEMMVANFLFDNNFIFQHNQAVTWADQDDFRATFYIPKLDLYIDNHPYDYIKEYQKSMKLKVKQYEKHKKKHLILTSEDEMNVEEAIRLKMKPYVIL
jgi:tetratricopeptide (TPR) repeat protein